jgi:hypothetical protein
LKSAIKTKSLRQPCGVRHAVGFSANNLTSGQYDHMEICRWPYIELQAFCQLPRMRWDFTALAAVVHGACLHSCVPHPFAYSENSQISATEADEEHAEKRLKADERSISYRVLPGLSRSKGNAPSSL